MSPWGLLIFFILTWTNKISGSAGEAGLSQFPRTLVTLVGGTVNLSCTASPDLNYYYRVHWVKLGSNETPLVIGNPGGKSGDKFQGVESFGVSSTLIITNVQLQDSGMYYCIRFTYYQVIFGTGSKLIVREMLLNPPTIFIYPPTPLEVGSNSTATLICLVTGISPEQMETSWNISGKTLK
uniref:Ig-like domain-containing protein n=1 Tax=Latimeria chalumnae TaxID=7897 RepID=H2ZT10_LATCH